VANFTLASLKNFAQIGAFSVRFQKATRELYFAKAESNRKTPLKKVLAYDM